MHAVTLGLTGRMSTAEIGEITRSTKRERLLGQYNIAKLPFRQIAFLSGALKRYLLSKTHHRHTPR